MIWSGVHCVFSAAEQPPVLPMLCDALLALTCLLVLSAVVSACMLAKLL